jgi:hypothetical protein
MVTKTATPLREAKAQHPAPKRICRHYWLIDPPGSRTSAGECLLCGERRTFPNYLSDCLIENDQEMFEEWLAKQGRRKPGRGVDETLAEIEEGA